MNYELNCGAFEQDLPDWVMGRLSSDSAREMQGHFAHCVVCQQKTAAERRLQGQWQALPSPLAVAEIEIGLRLAARVAESGRRRRNAGLRARAFGGMAFAAGLCFVLFRANLSEPSAAPFAEPQNASTPAPEPADQSSIARRAEQMRRAPAAENEAFLAETQQRHQEQRFALLGKDAP